MNQKVKTRSRSKCNDLLTTPQTREGSGMETAYPTMGAHLDMANLLENSIVQMAPIVLSITTNLVSLA